MALVRRVAALRRSDVEVLGVEAVIFDEFIGSFNVFTHECNEDGLVIAKLPDG